MKVKSKILIASVLLCASFSAHAESSSDSSMRRKIDSLEDKIEHLEKKIDRLNDRIDNLQDRRPSDDRHSESECRKEDNVKLVEKSNFNVIAENLCPSQCAKLLLTYQKRSSEKSYLCVKQTAMIW